MDIRVAPCTIKPSCDCSPEVYGFDREEHMESVHAPVTYWGVFLNDTRVSAASSRELAEKTKEWMENWLTDNQYRNQY